MNSSEEWPNILYINLCMFGSLTNLVNILIFLDSSLKDKVFRYLLMISINDFLYFSLTTLVFILRVVKNFSYISMLLELYSDTYFTSCLAIYKILIELVISLDRYFILCNKRLLKENSHKIVLPALLVISLAFYSPVLLMYDIKLESNSTTDYSLVGNNFYKSLTGETLLKIIWVSRAFVSSILLLIINIIASIKLNKISEKRMKMKSSKLIFYLIKY